MAGRKWGFAKTALTSGARKFQVAAVGFIAVVVAGYSDGHLSTGDKWEVAGAGAVALGVFLTPNTSPE